MHVGAAVVDRRLRLGRVLQLRLRSRLRLGQLRLQIVGRRRPERSRLPALEKGSQPQAAENQGEEALHGADATLPPLLAQSVAPSPEAASRRPGRLRPWEGEFGLERLRNNAFAGPAA